MYFLCRDVRCAVGIATIRRLGRFAQMKMKKWMSDLAGRRQKRHLIVLTVIRITGKIMEGLPLVAASHCYRLILLQNFLGMQKKKGVHTTLDTSGSIYGEEPATVEKFEKLMEVTDLVMLDIKEMDEEKHRELTGRSNKNILAMADKMNEMGKEMWIRHVLVPGLTDGKEDLKALRKKLDEWTNVSRVEILPYHTLGLFKWENLGIPYSLEGVPVPTEEQVKEAEEILGIKK